MSLKRLIALNTPIDTINLDYLNHQQRRYQNKVYGRYSKSTSMMEIEEEYPYGSMEFRKILVRLTTIPVVETGIKKGDDYKKITFIDQTERRGMGFMYRFQNNYWIVDNSTVRSGITDAVAVRRCNNFFRWKDTDGTVYNEPVSIHPQIFYNTNFSKAGPVTVSGYLKVYVQRNPRTLKIHPNMRFLIRADSHEGEGHYNAVKISGGGHMDFLNQSGDSLYDNSVTEFTLNEDYIIPGADDLVNGIAGAARNSYEVSTTMTRISGRPGEIFIVTGTPIFNGNEAPEKNLVWYTSNPDIVDLNISGNTATVSLKDEGEAKIVVSIGSDLTTSTIIDVISSSGGSVVNYVTRISPEISTIFEGSTQEFECLMYINGELQPMEGYEFSVNTDILNNNYRFAVIDDNKFSVTNIRRSTGKLRITADNPLSSATVNLSLGGVF